MLWWCWRGPLWQKTGSKLTKFRNIIFAFFYFYRCCCCLVFFIDFPVKLFHTKCTFLSEYFEFWSRSLNHWRIIFSMEITPFLTVTIHPCFKHELFLAEKHMTNGTFQKCSLYLNRVGSFFLWKTGVWTRKVGDRPTPLLLLPCQAPGGLVKFHILWGSPLRTVPLTVYKWDSKT